MRALRPLTLLLPASLAAAATVTATVDNTAAGTPISPWIYGTAQTDVANAKDLGLTTRRLGGNTLSTWNWKKGFWSSGADWYFVNNPKKESEAKGGKDHWWAGFTRDNRAAGLEGYLTIPTMGRVAKDGVSAGFDITKYPGQQSWEEKDHPGDLHPHAGNGKKVVKGADGKEKTEELAPNPDDTSIAMSPDEQCALLKAMVDEFGAADKGGAKFVVLDNEPALWHSTHRAMHPQGCSYDELWERTRTYAEKLKQIDPGVQVSGPAMWGWTEYWMSGLDAQLVGQGKGTWDAPPDFAKHGKVPLTKWWLQQVAAYDKEHGGDKDHHRLVDILDWHFYPQASTGGKPHDPAGMEARVQETRVMWDPSWKDPSWMGAQTGKVLRIIPLMKEWIAECDPGMKTAIGEYDFGGGGDASGGVAQAELLGVFAREGLDHAYYWFAPGKDSSIRHGFRLWRNPDGKGTAAGDRYLPSACDAPDDVSVHATSDGKGRLSLVLINKRAHPASVAVTFAKPLPEQRVTVWRFDDQDCHAIRAEADQALGGATLTVELPAIAALRLDACE